ncbi:MAG: hypothetical protein O3B13_05815 [Planctomycetota bacterium]|nr:hypothetical protein [Planctomycetota bacterium]
MRWKDWLVKWKLTSLKINVKFLEMEWNPSDEDRHAAWDMYVELLTRIATQPLADEEGDEASALKSLHAIFPLTREIIRSNFGCVEFTKIAVVVLNQVLRPFTARWHRLSLQSGFENPASCTQFRAELCELQKDMLKYTKMLGDMAGIEEDLTRLEGD